MKFVKNRALLYQRANGYSYDAVKILMPAGVKKSIYAPCVEHVPPDTTAGIFWLKNRDPAHWRDACQLEHVTGKYVIRDVRRALRSSTRSSRGDTAAQLRRSVEFERRRAGEVGS
jgi:hypothetical protein